MRKAGLSDTTIRRATAPPNKRKPYSDYPASGLILLVSGPPSTNKTWISKTPLAGRQEKITYGNYPSLALADARERWRSVDTAKRNGADLLTLRAIAHGADPAKPIAGPKSDATFERVIEDFTERHLRQRKRSASHISTTRGLFRNHVLPEWGKRDFTAIARKDIIKRLDEIADTSGPIAANRTLMALSKLDNWAVQRGIIESSRVAGIEKPGEETKRDRVLGDTELRLVWLSATQLGYPFGAFFRLLILLGQRRAETAAILWRDVDLDAGLLTLPAEITKNSKVHVITLAGAAVELFASLPRIGPYALTTTGETPISGYSKAKVQIDRMVAAAATAAGQAPPEPWTLHDLRRSAATGMARLGVPRFDIARVLNHTDASVTSGYDRYEYQAEKRAALARWAEHVTGLTQPVARLMLAHAR